MTIGAKIRNLREQYKLTLKEMADRVGISLSYLADMEKGRSNPSVDTLLSIARVLRKPAGYFLDDTVDILNVIESDPGYLVAAGKPVTPDQRLGIKRILEDPNLIRPNQIPIIGTVRSGIPILARENITGYLDVPPSIRADFALEITGDSMKYTGLNEGDMAICRETNAAVNGQIVIALINEIENFATLRYYIEQNGRGFLRAANPNCRDIEMGPGDQILGLVVEISKKPPTLNQYLEFLSFSRSHLAKWNEVINKALAAGIEPERVNSMIEMQVEIAKKVFEDGVKYRY
jgi:repressor LexA